MFHFGRLTVIDIMKKITKNNFSFKKPASNFGFIRNTSGFTIVELLVVIVIIGILAAITIVSYTGITQRATVSSLQSDLTSASQQLKLYNQLYSSYPTTMNGSNCPTAPTADNTYCLKASNGNTLVYSSITPTTFHLTDTNNNNTSYSTTDGTIPAVTTTIAGSSTGSACPTGFIPIPGSGTYGTNDFCVMKYAASQVGSSNIPTSIPSVQPWVNISQTTAIADAPNVASCTGCHLITEAEWMTIAQNVLSVASNWSSGNVGSGYIYSGHNDGAPGNALVPDPSDSNSYAGETNTGGNQRRTLTLTNGQVIWDFAGNVWQWTTGQTSNGQPGVPGNGYAWYEWTAISSKGNLSVNPAPTGTGILGSNIWNSSRGVGQTYSSADETTLRGFVHGGAWYDSYGFAGVLALFLNYTPGTVGGEIGFRVSR
jgi:prepilin-type N-terminal cleavage/methylation domain-containing protein